MRVPLLALLLPSLASTSALAAPGADAGTPPVRFAVAPAEQAVFYPTRALRKGDRFEVNVHHLGDPSYLVLVPCRPSCERPELAYAYGLQGGNQQLQIPASGQYVLWVESQNVRGKGFYWREGVYRQPLRVRESSSLADHFSATLDDGVQIAVRTLYAHPLDAGPVPN